MVPEGWDIKPLGSICDVKGGKRLPKGRFLTSKKTPFPYIRVSDMRDGYVDTSDIRYVPEDIAPSISRYTISSNDLFISVAGTLGVVGRVSQELDGANLTENADKLTNICVNKEFLLAVLQSPLVQKSIENDKTSNAQPKLALERIRSFNIPVPPLPEQRKIAEVLSTWNRAIEMAEALLVTARAQKRALMQSLLTGKRRFPEFEGQEWRAVRLGDIFRERTDRGDDSLPLLAITGGRGVIPQSETDRRDTSREDKSSYKQIHPGDIGYNSMRMWQGVSALSTLAGLVSPAYTIVISGPEILPEFAKHLFKLPQKIHLFRRYSQGLTSDTWNLKFKQFADVPSCIPSVKEQKKIADVLNDSDMEIKDLEDQVEKLRTEKKALMQQLLTGKRRVQV
ncbi:restriction endonuclease subunit S [Paracoccus sp. NFXS7]|uniref:restriction endonuclease subunit S n=1 Tax=Paracoccus sp. NFXS7 TaxID=2908653 RepID=UPI0032DED8D0